MFWKTFRVSDFERVVITVNGRFSQILKPGVYRMLAWPLRWARIEAQVLTVYDPTGYPQFFVFDDEEDIIDSVNDPEVEITRVVVKTGYVVSANLAFDLDDETTSSGPIPVY